MFKADEDRLLDFLIEPKTVVEIRDEFGTYPRGQLSLLKDSDIVHKIKKNGKIHWIYDNGKQKEEISEGLKRNIKTIEESKREPSFDRMEQSIQNKEWNRAEITDTTPSQDIVDTLTVKEKEVNPKKKRWSFFRKKK